MSQRGFTLLENISGLALVSILLGITIPCINLIETVRFNTIVSEVYLGVKSAQQVAHLGNKVCGITHEKDKSKPNTIEMYSTEYLPLKEIYTLPAHIQVFIGNETMTGKEFNIEFAGDMSPSQAGTISLINKKIQQKVQLTIRPATGKVTIYKYELD